MTVRILKKEKDIFTTAAGGKKIEFFTQIGESPSIPAAADWISAYFPHHNEGDIILVEKEED